LDCDLPSLPIDGHWVLEKVEEDRLAEYYQPMLRVSRNEPTLAASDSRQNCYRIAIFNLCIKSTKKANIFIVNVNVDEATKRSIFKKTFAKA